MYKSSFHSLFLAGGMIFLNLSGQTNPWKYSTNSWKIISSMSPKLHPAETKNIYKYIYIYCCKFLSKCPNLIWWHDFYHFGCELFLLVDCKLALRSASIQRGIEPSLTFFSLFRLRCTLQHRWKDLSLLLLHCNFKDIFVSFSIFVQCCIITWCNIYSLGPEAKPAENNWS